MFFLFRKVWLLIALGLAFLVPYGLLGKSPRAIFARAKSMWAGSSPAADAAGSSPVTLTNARIAESRLPASQKIEQIIHFQWTPSRILSVWPSATRVFDEEYAGLRVPLMTGTTAEDLAGSLTYYFDAQNRVRRIVFEGVTGDARPLVQHVVSRFGLRSQRSLLAGLYVASWNGVPRSVLRLTYPPTIDASQVRARVNVVLELNLPAADYRLSRRLARVLEQDKSSGRWSG